MVYNYAKHKKKNGTRFSIIRANCSSDIRDVYLHCRSGRVERGRAYIYYTNLRENCIIYKYYTGTHDFIKVFS